MDNKPKSYVDIGHGLSDAVVWLYRGGHIWKGLASGGTHERRWGLSAIHYWRGRYEPKTNRLSIVAPIVKPYASPPRCLLIALEAAFGETENAQFNPLGTKIR